MISQREQAWRDRTMVLIKSATPLECYTHPWSGVGTEGIEIIKNFTGIEIKNIIGLFREIPFIIKILDYTQIRVGVHDFKSIEGNETHSHFNARNFVKLVRKYGIQAQIITEGDLDVYEILRS